MAKNRPGRPSKPGDRKPSGDLRFIPDRGSPLMLLRRVELVDSKFARLPQEGDDEFAQRISKHQDAHDKRVGYPLGIMLIKRQITSEEHYAGRRYMGLFVRAVRGVGVQSVLANFIGAGSLAFANVARDQIANDDVGAEIRRAYLEAREALERAGRRATYAVDDVAIYELPRFHLSRMGELKRGLSRLAEHFDESDKRSGR